jgi:ABC-type antimicrobial peptide transport system permease subunit
MLLLPHKNRGIVSPCFVPVRKYTLEDSMSFGLAFFIWTFFGGIVGTVLVGFLTFHYRCTNLSWWSLPPGIAAALLTWNYVHEYQTVMLGYRWLNIIGAVLGAILTIALFGIFVFSFYVYRYYQKHPEELGR